MNDESFSHKRNVEDIDHVQRECSSHGLQGERNSIDYPIWNRTHEDEEEERERYFFCELPAEQVQAASGNIEHHGKARNEIYVAERAKDVDEQGQDDGCQSDRRARSRYLGQLVSHDVDQIS